MNVVQPYNTVDALGHKKRSTLLPYVPGPSSLTAETNYFNVFYPLTFEAISPTSVTSNSANTPAGSEAIILTFGRMQHAIQVSGTFVATITVEATLDPDLAVWNALDTINAANIKQYTGIYYALRVSITGYTSGNPFVIVQSQR